MWTALEILWFVTTMVCVGKGIDLLTPTNNEYKKFFASLLIIIGIISMQGFIFYKFIESFNTIAVG